MNENKDLYSIIVPVLNITDSLVELTNRIDTVLKSRNYSFEIIFIDDGSTDPNTLETMKKIQESSLIDVTVISFFKNFGQQAGILAGIKLAKGNYLITMDGDLEHRPEDLFSLIDKQKEGNFDVVFGNFKEKTHGATKKFFSFIYTSIERKILQYPKGTKRSAFWVMKRAVGEEVLKFNTLNPSLSILIIKVTNHIGSAEIVQGKRGEGESAYTIPKLILLASSLFINNSGIFLRSFLVFASISFLLVVLGFFSQIFLKIWYLFALTCLIPIVLIGFAIVGEYLFRIIQNIENHPLYSIREIIKKD